MPYLSPIWFRVTPINGLGGTHPSEIKNMTLDIPRNASFPFVNEVTAGSISLNWTDTNPTVIDPICGYIIMYKESTDSSWENLTSCEKPDSTLSLTYKHKDTFKRGSEHLYRVCPANSIGTGPCSEPALHAYAVTNTKVSRPPEVFGYPVANSYVRFTDYNNFTDKIAVAWELYPSYANSTLKYGVISLFSGDLYSTVNARAYNIFDSNSND